MRFVRCAAAPFPPKRLGIFPGSFNPVTIAHLALAHAALDVVDEVVFVLPRAFPHKPYSGATFDQRLELLAAALNPEPNCSIAASQGGLFIEIARECRKIYGPVPRLSFLCGRDAAERISGWDYGAPGAWREMLREFDLLVADRRGEYLPEAAELASFQSIRVDPACDEVSASEVRRRIAHGEPWEHLTPEAIHQRLREIYTPA